MSVTLSLRAVIIGVLAGLMLLVQPGAAVAAAPAELRDRAWLGEILRHLYRWYVDEPDIQPFIDSNEVLFWVREQTPRLDEGDRSLFAEVILPQCGVIVKVKKADYDIPELDATVRNTTFRITSIEHVELPVAKPDGVEEIRFVYTELRDELFRTRSQAAFPEGQLLERLRAAVRAELVKHPERLPAGGPVEAQVVYVAPLSPIANETWVYWETGRTLIRFASDIDLMNPAVWEHEKLAIRLYHLDKDVVVSLDDVGGSNAFMTRDHAGRALYNCIVVGRRLELHPPAGAPQAR